MSQLKRIDEYVSKLLADSAMNEHQMAIILTAEGGESEPLPLSNGRCTNGDFVTCSRSNTYCINYQGYCGNSPYNGDCDNSQEKPGVINPGLNPCPLSRCQM